jgi:spoIIIJ-associated protein
MTENNSSSDDEEESYDMDPEAMQAEADRASAFLDGLALVFGSAGASTATITDDSISVALDGPDLGLLIGPRGQTLQAIQDLTRASAQRGGRAAARLLVDVGGYRMKRNEALTRFAVQIANEVASSGTPRSLEPMSAPDRKVIHDAVQTVAGVESISEGEDPGRFILIRPAG